MCTEACALECDSGLATTPGVAALNCRRGAEHARHMQRCTCKESRGLESAWAETWSEHCRDDLSLVLCVMGILDDSWLLSVDWACVRAGRSLNLSDNALGEKGVRAFATAISEQACLTHCFNCSAHRKAFVAVLSSRGLAADPCCLVSHLETLLLELRS